MSYSYFTFDLSDDSKIGVIEDIDNVENDHIDDFMLNEGISINQYFPADCELQFDNDSGDLVTDFIENIDNLVIISGNAKKIFEKFIVNNKFIEYLSFKLLNKKGKPAADTPFYIANSLYNLTCLDFEAIEKKAVENGVEDDENSVRHKGVYYRSSAKIKVSDITFCSLNEDDLPKDAVFFRIGECPKHIAIRSDLVEALREAGMTNLNLIPCGERL